MVINNINKYEDIKNRIDFVYPVKIREQKEIIQKFWRDLKDEISELESIVKKDFGERIKEVDLNGAEILDYTARYFPNSKCLKMKITRFKFPDGKIIDDLDKSSLTENCPHIYLNPIGGYTNKEDIHSTIKEFMNKYNIRRIKGPNHLCGHK